MTTSASLLASTSPSSPVPLSIAAPGSAEAQAAARSALSDAAGAPAVFLFAAHPMTVAIYNLLRDRGLADKRLVFEALNARVGNQLTTKRQEVSSAQVALYVERFGVVPSPGEWDRWKRSDDAPSGLRSASYIRTSFGESWDDVRAAFGKAVPQADALAHRELLGQRAGWSAEQLVVLVQVWAETVSGSLGRGAFVDWCVAHPVVEGVGPTPQSWTPVRAHFASWPDLLEAAGLEHRSASRMAQLRAEQQAEARVRRESARAEARVRQEAARAAARTRRLELEQKRRAAAEADADSPPRRRGRPARSPEARAARVEARHRQREARLRQQEAERVAREARLIEGARAWAESFEGALTRQAFEEHLSLLDGRTGLPLTFEPYKALVRNWTGLLVRLGLEHRSARALSAQHHATRAKPPGAAAGSAALAKAPTPVRLPNGAPVEPELRWLRYAALRLGPLMSYPQYNEWRARLINAAIRHGRPQPAIPSSSFFMRRLGGWLEAKQAAGVLSAELASERPDRRRHGRRRLVEAVGLAMTRYGSLLSDRRYGAWRSAQVAAAHARGDEPAVPARSLVVAALGGEQHSWVEVRRAALAEMPAELRRAVEQRDRELTAERSASHNRGTA